MVTKAPMRTPVRQRSKFSSIFDALVSAPPVRVEPLPEMRRTFVNKNPDEEFMRMEQMMSMRSPMAAPAPMRGVAHSAGPGTMRTAAMPASSSTPIAVASTPGGAPVPNRAQVPGRGPPPGPEKRMDTLLRGIGNFLGYAPKGGARGDRTELIADFARGLLGEKPIREEEAEANQRMAEEMLRRAIATGDVNEIARLDPDMAMKLQEFGTFDEDRANKLIDVATQQQIDRTALDQTREENRILAASRAVAAANELSGGDPARFNQIMSPFADEQPNLLTQTEMQIAAQAQGGKALERYFRQIRTGGSGSAARPYAINHPTLGNVMYDPNMGEIMTDEQGNPVRPVETFSARELGPGIVRQFGNLGSPGTGSGAPVAAPGVGAGAGDVTGPGFPPPPGDPATAQSLTDTVIDAEARRAQAVARASAVGAAEIKEGDAVAALMRSGPPVIASIDRLESFADEDLDLIAGMPTLEKLKFGGLGFVPITQPGSRAATVMSEYDGLMKDVRQIGFDNLKGAGQVTEAESLFASQAAANLLGGKYAGPTEMRRQMDAVRRVILAAITTREARRKALAEGDDLLAFDTSEEAIMLLRQRYGETAVPSSNRPSDLPPRNNVRTREETQRRYTPEEVRKLVEDGTFTKGTVFVGTDGVEREVK